MESFIRESYKNGMQPKDLTSQYTLYGQDPIIVTDTHPLPPDRFSAWEFARAFALGYCERRANG